MPVLVRTEVVRRVGVFMRAAAVSRLLVDMAALRDGRMRMLVDMVVGMRVHVFVGVYAVAMPVRVPVRVQMLVRVHVTVFIAGFHVSPPLNFPRALAAE